MTLKHFGFTIVAAAGLTCSAQMTFAQGAVHPGMSMYATRVYDAVERETADGNKLNIQRGMLTFDPRTQVTFAAQDGAELVIPYKAIKSLEYSFYNPIQITKEPSTEKGISRFVPRLPKGQKVGGKRYLIVRYETAEGLQSTVLAFEPDRYTRVFGTFNSKTGLTITRTGMEAGF